MTKHCGEIVRLRLILSTVVTCMAAQPAIAGEIFGGAFVHDVKTPLNKSGQENGLDGHLGWRGARIDGLSWLGRPAPHVYATVNTAGDTNIAAVGLDWKIGSKFYLRPGIGLAVHDGPRRNRSKPDRIWFGSRLLFAPEVALGLEMNDRVSVEAAWVHFSHARLFGNQNPGTDSFGLRLNYRY